MPQEAEIARVRSGSRQDVPQMSKSGAAQESTITIPTYMKDFQQVLACITGLLGILLPVIATPLAVTIPCGITMFLGSIVLYQHNA